jgi:hypothetical protein
MATVGVILVLAIRLLRQVCAVHLRTFRPHATGRVLAILAQLFLLTRMENETNGIEQELSGEYGSGSTRIISRRDLDQIDAHDIPRLAPDQGLNDFQHFIV